MTSPVIFVGRPPWGRRCNEHFFVVLSAMSRDSWQLSSPVGYSYQTLDQLLLSSLKWDSSRLGLRLDNLPVEVRHIAERWHVCPWTIVVESVKMLVAPWYHMGYVISREVESFESTTQSDFVFKNEFIIESSYKASIGRFSKDNTKSNENAKERRKDWIRLPVFNLPLCTWSIRFLDLHAP